MAVPSPELTALAEQRLADARSIAAYQLPELPDTEAAEVYERIEAAERQVASPDRTKAGYEYGVAQVADQPQVALGTSPVLLSTEHATDQRRFNPQTNERERKDGDWGVGGLARVLHEDTGATYATLLGRQTGDANNDPEHPFKDLLGSLIISEKPSLIAPLHSVGTGKVSDLTDKKAFDVFIGIGEQPTSQSQQFADILMAEARNYDLRAGINERFIKMASVKEGRPKLGPDGRLAYVSYSASGAGTTRVYAEGIAAEQRLEAAAVQIELSSLLTILPVNFERDRRTRVMGVYVGYLLVKNSMQAYLKQVAS